MKFSILACGFASLRLRVRLSSPAFEFFDTLVGAGFSPIGVCARAQRRSLPPLRDAARKRRVERSRGTVPARGSVPQYTRQGETMAPNWILSAHGTYEYVGKHEIYLYNKEVCFFVKDEKILYNIFAWPYFNQLTACGSEMNVYLAAHRYGNVCKQKSWNYTATGTKDFPSGLYEVGSNRPFLKLDPNDQITLAQIVGHKDFPGRLYWLACRVYAPQRDSGLKPKVFF
jgi:hypothetical protein